jgi:hypothetical protein
MRVCIKILIEWFSFIKSDIKFLFGWKLWDQNETWEANISVLGNDHDIVGAWTYNISINYKFMSIK